MCRSLKTKIIISNFYIAIFTSLPIDRMQFKLSEVNVSISIHFSVCESKLMSGKPSFAVFKLLLMIGFKSRKNHEAA